MERFVQAIVAGGLALVAGLWLLTLQPGGTFGWYNGVALVAVGAVAIAAGIWTKIDW